MPWHRELVNRFEALLQEVDPTVTLYLIGVPGALFLGILTGLLASCRSSGRSCRPSRRFC